MEDQAWVNEVLAAKNGHIERLAKARDAALEQNEFLKNTITEQRAELDALALERADEKGPQARCGAHVETLNEELDALAHELEALQKSYDAEHEKAVRLEARLHELNSAYTDRVEAVMQLQGVIADNERDTKRLMAELNKVYREHRELHDKLAYRAPADAGLELVIAVEQDDYMNAYIALSRLTRQYRGVIQNVVNLTEDENDLLQLIQVSLCGDTDAAEQAIIAAIRGIADRADDYTDEALWSVQRIYRERA